MKKRNRKKNFLLLKSVVALLLVTLLVWLIDWTAVWSQVVDVNVYYLTLYTILYITGLVISAVKWQILASVHGFVYPFQKYFGWYLTGTFLNNFLPGFVGGDTYRSYRLGAGDKRYSQSSATVTFDRISGLIAILVLVIVCGFLAVALSTVEPWLILAYTFVATTILLALFFWRISLVSLRAIVKRFLPQTFVVFLDDVVHYANRNIVVRTLSWSFLFAVVGLAVTNYTLFLSVGITLNIIDFLSIIFLLSIISSIPISINNIGVKEWGYVVMFGALGVAQPAAVTVVLIGRFIQMLVSLFAVPLYLREKNDEIV
ncbi:MAG: flippase-like domain-containing protein [Candidatus Moranbacteria bacterium]|nr:flippase-like domain-containing protein [Candidatus Moranbacteria bacterium]